MFSLKKYLLATSLALALASGLTVNVGNTEAASNNSHITVSSTWTWYYTDYAYSDGWYAKWYKNFKTGREKKETYNSKNKLVSVNYY